MDTKLKALLEDISKKKPVIHYFDEANNVFKVMFQNEIMFKKNKTYVKNRLKKAGYIMTDFFSMTYTFTVKPNKPVIK